MSVAPETASARMPVISALAGIGGAMGSQWLAHRFTTEREKRASKDKQQRELYFIATELVFMLERLAQQCVPAAYESGYNDYENGYIRIEHGLPDIDYAEIRGDWRSLPPELMYRLTQIPVLQYEARKSVAAAFDNDSPLDGDEGVLELNRQACRLGLRAIRITRELRRFCAMPDDTLSDHPWSAWRTLASRRWGLIDTDLQLTRRAHKAINARSLRAPTANPPDTVLPGKE